MLKKLFDNILALESVPGQSFIEKIFNKWTGLIPVLFADDTKLNFLIDLFNIKTNKGKDLLFVNIDQTMFIGFLPKLIYGFRNSMVHNRETEFHLTHRTLLNHPVIGNAALVVLENFLLPIMEELAFFLIINENSIVWYDKSSLKLWEES